MSNYRRLISYIYAYEGGVKGKNIGFAKIETRGIQCKITVSVKRVYVGGNDIGVYLLAGEQEIYLGNIFIRGGSGEFRAAVSASDIEHSGIAVDQCFGLTIHDVKNTWRSYTTIWEDAVSHAAEVELKKASPANQNDDRPAISEEQIKKAVREIEEEFPLQSSETSENKDTSQQQAEDAVGEENLVASLESDAIKDVLENDAGADSLEMQNNEGYIVGDSESMLDAQQQGGMPGMTGPTRGMTGPTQGMTGPNRGMTGPTQGMTGPTQGMTGPNRGMTGPTQGMTGPTRGMTGPTQGMTGPNRGMTGPTQGMTGPNRGMTGPTAGATGPSPMPVNEPIPTLTGPMTITRPIPTGPVPVTNPVFIGPIPGTGPRTTGPTPPGPTITGPTVGWDGESSPFSTGPVPGSRPVTTGPVPGWWQQPPSSTGPTAGVPRANRTGATGPVSQEWSDQGEESQDTLDTLAYENKAGQMEAEAVPAEAISYEDSPSPGRTLLYRVDAPLKEEPVQHPDTPKLGNPADLERLLRNEGQEESPHDIVWDKMRREHTRILAFDYEEGCEILTIKPQDIGLLPRDAWVYGNNSFLLHGYYNYRYLILAKLFNENGMPRYLLGVPGHYYSNERYMASMFGFPNFVLSKEQPVEDGRFGFWYTDVKIGG